MCVIDVSGKSYYEYTYLAERWAQAGSIDPYDPEAARGRHAQSLNKGVGHKTRQSWLAEDFQVLFVGHSGPRGRRLI